MIALLRVAGAALTWLLILNGGGIAETIQSKIDIIVENAEANCGENFAISDVAISLIDLDKSGEFELGIVSEAGFHCPKYGFSYYCGSGGCTIHFIASEDKLSEKLQAWDLVENKDGKQAIRLHYHGSECDTLGYKKCQKFIIETDGKLVITPKL